MTTYKVDAAASGDYGARRLREASQKKAQKFALQQTGLSYTAVDEGNLLIDCRGLFTYHPKMEGTTDLSDLLLNHQL